MDATASKSDDRFQPKSPERLASEATAVAERLGSVALTGPETGASPKDAPSQHNLREEYPLRWAAHVAALRDIRNPGAPESITAFVDALRVLHGIRECIARHDTGIDTSLRPAQIEAFRSFADALEFDDRRGYFRLPTGFGKTVLMAILARYSGQKTLIIVPKSGLAGQTKEKFERFCPGVQFTEHHGSLKQGAGQIVVTTQQYLLNEMKRPESERTINPADYSLVFVDEAHKALGGETRTLIEERLSPNAVVVGFSATPEYSKERSVKQVLPACFDDVTLRDGIRMGALSPVVSCAVMTRIDLSDLQVLGTGEYDEQAFAKRVKEKGLSKSAIEIYKNKFEGRSLIGFCAGVAHAEECAREFSAAGVAAAALSGDTPKAERDRVIEAYNRGEIKALFSADLLTEGFDAPIASVCFNLTPTSSLVRAEQRGGRVLRLNDDAPHKVATVVDFLFEDKIHTGKNPPILFAEILNGTACPPSEDQAAEKENVDGELARLREDIGDVKVITDYQELLSEKKAACPHAVHGTAPEGWISLVEVSEKLGRSGPWILNRARSEAGDDKVFGRFVDPNGSGITYFFEPSFGLSLDPYVDKKMRAEGWLSRREILRATNLPTSRFNSCLEDLRDKGIIGDEDCKKARGLNGRIVDFYSPTVIQKMRELATRLGTDTEENRRYQLSDRAERSAKPKMDPVSKDQMGRSYARTLAEMHAWLSDEALKGIVAGAKPQDVWYVEGKMCISNALYHRVNSELSDLKSWCKVNSVVLSKTVAELAERLKLKPEVLAQNMNTWFKRSPNNSLTPASPLPEAMPLLVLKEKLPEALVGPAVWIKTPFLPSKMSPDHPLLVCGIGHRLRISRDSKDVAIYISPKHLDSLEADCPMLVRYLRTLAPTDPTASATGR